MNPLNINPRFVGMVRPAGTKSFRLACGKLFEFGSNAQNPCKPLLACLQARKGHSFVQPDQAGAEALVVAHLTRPGTYRALFHNKIKPHTFLALHIFGPIKQHWFTDLPTTREDFLSATDPALLAKLPGWIELNARIADSDSEPDRPYYSGKRTCHARSYKMGWKTFQLALLKDSHGTMVLDKLKAEGFLGMFDLRFDEIIEWQYEVPLIAKACGELRNLFDYPRRCDRIFTAGYERELISWIPQSTVGVITHKCVIATSKHIESTHRKWNIINNKHDSALVEVPDEQVNDCARFMTKAMAVELKGRDGVEFVMRSDVQVGKNWAPYSAKNPDGMRGYKIQ